MLEIIKGQKRRKPQQAKLLAVRLKIVVNYNILLFISTFFMSLCISIRVFVPFYC